MNDSRGPSQRPAGGATPELARRVAERVRDIPDFPQPGVLFKDITPVVGDPELFPAVVDAMAYGWGDVDVIVGIESRGFIFGGAMVERLDRGFVPARKKGKLPWKTVAVSYELEYGTATLELHEDAIRPGQRVLIVDDLLATGGTAAATVELVRRLGGVVVGCSFCIDLAFLPGRSRLEALGLTVRSVLAVH